VYIESGNFVIEEKPFFEPTTSEPCTVVRPLKNNTRGWRYFSASLRKTCSKLYFIEAYVVAPPHKNKLKDTPQWMFNDRDNNYLKILYSSCEKLYSLYFCFEANRRGKKKRRKSDQNDNNNIIRRRRREENLSYY